MSTRVTRLFISYKTGPNDGLTSDANNLKERLSNVKNEHSDDARYDVWMDDELEAGIAFNFQIYEQIPQCDILLLLMSEKSAESKWVNREVDVAKGAGVFILPLLIRGVEKPDALLDAFDLKDIQYLDYTKSSKDQFTKVCAAIDARSRATYVKQKERFEALQKRNEEKRTIIENSEQEYAIYALNNINDNCKVYIAAGNIVDMVNIDVFVNSENDYMQMARAFESTTVSSMLRYQGSRIENNELLDDTVQNELNLASDTRFGHRPVADGVIIPTSSGHPDGSLYQENKAYYIFHAASVKVVGYGVQRKTEPMDVSTIKNAIKIALTKTIPEINQAKGVISPASTRQRAVQELRANSNEYENISSIIFPMFGTGHAKRPTEEALGPIAEAFIDFIRKNPNSSVQKIYLCVRYHEELEIADRIFTAKGLKKVQ